MAGHEEKFSYEVFKSDETDGIIPRAIKNLWYIIEYEGSFHSQVATGTLLKLPSLKFTTNRSGISSTQVLEFFTAGGIQPTGSLWRIW